MQQPNGNDQAKFAEALTVLALALGAEMDADRMRVYGTLLLPHFSVEQLEQACYDFTRDLGRKFFPTVPEFHEKLIGSPESNATKAIFALERAMKDRGAYASVSFQDAALTNAIVYAGGWIEVCRMYRDLGDKEFGYWQHRFREVYIESAKERRTPACKYFAGIFELNNVSNSATWDHGRLPEPKVSVVALNGTITDVPLAEIEPKAELVGLYRKFLAAPQEAESSANASPRTLEG
jgi:hypothetical protein